MKIIKILSFLLCVVSSFFIRGYASSVADPNLIRVMTINLREHQLESGAQRKVGIQKIINGESPSVKYVEQQLGDTSNNDVAIDFVAMQEHNDGWYSDLPYYKWSTATINGRELDKGTYSNQRIVYNGNRWDLIAKGAQNLIGGDQWGQRYLVWGKFKEKTTGKQLMVVSYHGFTESGCSTSWRGYPACQADPSHAQAFKQITDLMNNAGMPAIFMGDLNPTKVNLVSALKEGGFSSSAVIAQRTFDTSTSTYTGYGWLNLGYGSGDGNPNQSYPQNENHGAYYDYIFVTNHKASPQNNLEAIAYTAVVDRFKSSFPTDHLPIYAVLKFSSQYSEVKPYPASRPIPNTNVTTDTPVPPPANSCDLPVVGTTHFVQYVKNNVAQPVVVQWQKAKDETKVYAYRLLDFNGNPITGMTDKAVGSDLQVTVNPSGLGVGKTYEYVVASVCKGDNGAPNGVINKNLATKIKVDVQSAPAEGSCDAPTITTEQATVHIPAGEPVKFKWTPATSTQNGIAHYQVLDWQNPPQALKDPVAANVNKAVAEYTDASAPSLKDKVYQYHIASVCLDGTKKINATPVTVTVVEQSVKPDPTPIENVYSYRVARQYPHDGTEMKLTYNTTAGIVSKIVEDKLQGTLEVKDAPAQVKLENKGLTCTIQIASNGSASHSGTCGGVNIVRQSEHFYILYTQKGLF